MDEKHTIKITHRYTIEVQMWGASDEAIGECLADIKREAVRVSKRRVLDRRYKVEIVGARLV